MEGEGVFAAGMLRSLPHPHPPGLSALLEGLLPDPLQCMPLPPPDHPQLTHHGLHSQALPWGLVWERAEPAGHVSQAVDTSLSLSHYSLTPKGA